MDAESGNISGSPNQTIGQLGAKQDNRQTISSMSSHEHILSIKFADTIQDVLKIRFAGII